MESLGDSSSTSAAAVVSNFISLDLEGSFRYFYIIFLFYLLIIYFILFIFEIYLFILLLLFLTLAGAFKR